MVRLFVFAVVVGGVGVARACPPTAQTWTVPDCASGWVAVPDIPRAYAAGLERIVLVGSGACDVTAKTTITRQVVVRVRAPEIVAIACLDRRVP